MKTKKLNVEMHCFSGETICEVVSGKSYQEYPAIIVLNGDRAFYRVGCRDKGMLGLYQECDTQTISLG